MLLHGLPPTEVAELLRRRLLRRQLVLLEHSRVPQEEAAHLELLRCMLVPRTAPAQHSQVLWTPCAATHHSVSALLVAGSAVASRKVDSRVRRFGAVFTSRVCVARDLCWLDHAACPSAITALLEPLALPAATHVLCGHLGGLSDCRTDLFCTLNRQNFLRGGSAPAPPAPPPGRAQKLNFRLFTAQHFTLTVAGAACARPLIGCGRHRRRRHRRPRPQAHRPDVADPLR